VESYRFCVSERLQLTIAFDEPDENGWIVARVLEVPSALSQGRSREDALTNIIEALCLLLTPGAEEPRTFDERTELLELMLIT
jgi:predicted RNase H-like HicB family nuclease